jgi:hypothetical protein
VSLTLAESLNSVSCSVSIEATIVFITCSTRLHEPRPRLASKSVLLPTMIHTHQTLIALVLLSTVVSSSPATFRVDNAPEYPLLPQSFEASFEGFDWDLEDMRLIQMAPDAKPVWMTELEKVFSTFIYLV